MSLDVKACGVCDEKQQKQRLNSENDKLKTETSCLKNENKEVKEETKVLNVSMEWIERDRRTNNVLLSGILIRYSK